MLEVSIIFVCPLIELSGMLTWDSGSTPVFSFAEIVCCFSGLRNKSLGSIFNFDFRAHV